MIRKLLFSIAFAASLPFGAFAQQAAPEQIASIKAPTSVNSISPLFTLGEYEVRVAKKPAANTPGDIYFTLKTAMVSPSGETAGTVWIDNPHVTDWCRGTLSFTTAKTSDGSTTINASGYKDCKWEWTVTRLPDGSITGTTAAGRRVTISKK